MGSLREDILWFVLAYRLYVFARRSVVDRIGSASIGKQRRELQRVFERDRVTI